MVRFKGGLMGKGRLKGAITVVIKCRCLIKKIYKCNVKHACSQ